MVHFYVNIIFINIERDIGVNTECFDSNGTEKFKCECSPRFEGPSCELFICEANPCCESGPTPLCCRNGVCSNDDFVYNPIINNVDECQCLCKDNYTGSFKYSDNYSI